jgi:hypothetical protein
LQIGSRRKNTLNRLLRDIVTPTLVIERQKEEELKQERSTRWTWISWRRPNFGAGAIRDRERNNLASYKKADTEHPLFLPLQLRKGKCLDVMDEEAAVFYRNLAFLDMATLGKLCRNTCGNSSGRGRKKEVGKSNFSKNCCVQQFFFYGMDTVFNVDAVLKVRCSAGFQVKSYLSTEAGALLYTTILGERRV